ncbi:SNF2 protein [Ordospora pajunii]|uniref:SNF2 protein n=1 Tax=Ordospora pajunii TaxID=3039483 RepID=UPI00295273F8|nr:SNF2 protein [Ordospora pajunii]KAH9411453.1 SNF2 protein [Ordospora pajunii]
MNLDVLKKYRSFIGDNEFFRTFIPGYEEIEKADAEPAEPYVFESSPKYVQAELRDYQVEGLNWLVSMHENSINCILADEMGLGKTLQTVAFLGYIRYVRKEESRHLVVVPKSTLNNWRREFKRFMPKYKVRVFYSSRKELRQLMKELRMSKWDVCLTTYEMCIGAKSMLSKIEWSYIVIDEAHRIKNEHSLLSKIVRVFPCRHRLLITGTPLQNNVHELWALLNFIAPEIFNDSEKFEAYVMRSDCGESEGIAKIRSVLQLFFLRREKIDVERTLLPKKVVNLYSPLSPMQHEWYKMLLKRDLSPLGGSRDAKGMLMNVVMQLRKCCNHPYLFPGAEPEPYTNGEHIVENSGKMQLLDKLLSSLASKESRVLIFSQMSMMLDILEDYLVLRGHEYCRIDGSTPYEERAEYIDAFNAEGSKKFVFLLTTRAGGLGINLCTADTVILFDSDWNPQMDLQAQDRVHRIGQKKQVTVFRLICEGTVEEQIVYRSLQKLRLDDILLQGRSKKGAPSQSELIDILASGMEITDSSVKDEEIEEVIKRGEEKTREMNMKLGEFKIGDASEAGLDCYKWEGEDYNVKKIDKFVSKNLESHGRMSRVGVLFAPKPKVVEYQDYQFYPKELRELNEKELWLYKEGKELCEDEKSLKKQLLQQGFDWTKKDFQAYLKAIEAVGKDDAEAIAALVGSRSDVREYHRVFWERIDELNDAEKIKMMVERSIRRIKKQARIRQILEEDMDVIEMRMRPSMSEYDKLLLNLYKKYIDEPEWQEWIAMEVLKAPEFQFDYYVLSRTASDVFKHVNHLISALIRSFSESNAA